jgi:hypothetical protein
MNANTMTKPSDGASRYCSDSDSDSALIPLAAVVDDGSAIHWCWMTTTQAAARMHEGGAPYRHVRNAWTVAVIFP